MTERCFACHHPIRPNSRLFAFTVDGTWKNVGSDCYRHIMRAGTEGYQPPKRRPRLYSQAALISVVSNNRWQQPTNGRQIE